MVFRWGHGDVSSYQSGFKEVDVGDSGCHRAHNISSSKVKLRLVERHLENSQDRN
jgi:hypothetical protein